MYRCILVPVDGDTTPKLGLRHAIGKRERGEIVIDFTRKQEQ